jgi:hypothetical protein
MAHSRTLTTLNLQRRGYPEHNVFEYFQILRDESYVEFDAMYENNWSAVQIAIRSETYSLDALKFLSKLGVDLARIDGKGKSALHIAAELTDDVRILEYLGSESGWASINRQD